MEILRTSVSLGRILNSSLLMDRKLRLFGLKPGNPSSDLRAATCRVRNVQPLDPNRLGDFKCQTKNLMIKEISVYIETEKIKNRPPVFLCRVF